MAQKTFAGGSRFAHLLGRGKRATAAKAEDTDEDEEMKGRAKKAEDGGDTSDPDENEDKKKDELDDTADEHTDDEGKADPEADEDPDDEDARKAKRAKAKAKAEEGDDDSDDKDEKDAKASAVRRRERARCAAIFAAPAAASRPDFAAHLAFGTSMNRSSAVAMLEAASAGHGDDDRPQPRGSRSLRQRMERAPAPNVGPNGGAKPLSGVAGFAAQMAAVNKIRHGEA